MPRPRQERPVVTEVYGYEDGAYRYEPGLQIGYGATSYVFAGLRYPTESETGSQGVPVALKYQPYDETSAPVVRERVEREKRMADQLAGCDGIVPVWSIFDDTEHSMVVTAMPLLTGRTLKQEISDAISFDRVLSYIVQIGAILDFMHDHGVVYHDLKPANMLLEEDRVRLIDLGAAELVGSPQDAREGIIGSVHYVAPERFSEPVSRKSSDVYAFGAVAYQLLTGHVPFDDRKGGEIMRQHVEGAVPRFDHFIVGPISGDLQAAERCVRHALAKNPHDRYPSAGAFVQALVTEVTEQRYREHATEEHIKIGIASAGHATTVAERMGTVQHFEDALSEDEESVTAAYLLSCSLAVAGRAEESMKVLQEIDRLTPRDQYEADFKQQAAIRLQELERPRQGFADKILGLLGLRRT